MISRSLLIEAALLPAFTPPIKRALKLEDEGHMDVGVAFPPRGAIYNRMAID